MSPAGEASAHDALQACEADKSDLANELEEALKQIEALKQCP